jgi:predicted metal-dependent phosphoesterase TrpH
VAKADLHIHTRVSDGLATVERLLEYVEHETDLDVIAVTDHEDADGGLRAREVAARRGYRFEIVAGAEVTTRQGHLLALFIEECPRSFRSVEATLEAIHRQGGLAVVPHPNSWLTRSISRRTVDRVQGRAEAGIRFDAVETANPSPAGRQARKSAEALAAAWSLPAAGGSDAHHLPCVGRGWTEFEGKGAEGLRAALTAGTTRAGLGRYPTLREIGYAQTAIGLAWGYSATPRKMLRAPMLRRARPA